MTVRLLVGLGNPGPEYAATRHNAGAMLVEQLARQHGVSLSPESKFFGLTARLQLGGQDLRLLVPATFMNRSGQAVLAMASFYRIGLDELLIAHDELDLPVGSARFKQGGGNGGHNGLKDISSKFGGSGDYLRLRLGIGHPGDKSKVTGFVLGRAPQAEQQLIDDSISAAIKALPLLLKDGTTAAMQQLHSHRPSL
mgnify:CR=1 FL=1